MEIHLKIQFSICRRESTASTSVAGMSGFAALQTRGPFTYLPSRWVVVVKAVVVVVVIMVVVVLVVVVIVETVEVVMVAIVTPT